VVVNLRNQRIHLVKQTFLPLLESLHASNPVWNRDGQFAKQAVFSPSRLDMLAKDIPQAPQFNKNLASPVSFAPRSSGGQFAFQPVHDSQQPTMLKLGLRRHTIPLALPLRVKLLLEVGRFNRHGSLLRWAPPHARNAGQHGELPFEKVADPQQFTSSGKWRSTPRTNAVA
jgi:hypothetical protein